MYNLKSAINKLGKNQEIAGNQLVFKEKEALLVTGMLIGLPTMVILGTLLMEKM
ncbi:hypothetical protein [Anaerosolibacter sp.]|uniref:hypothetical protein n=1 Tax=Anaerosolibacter sp. TaxID=1872527 RepID=UPI0039EF169C